MWDPAEGAEDKRAVWGQPTREHRKLRRAWTGCVHPAGRVSQPRALPPPERLFEVQHRGLSRQAAALLIPLWYHLKDGNDYILAAFLLSLRRHCVGPCRLGNSWELPVIYLKGSPWRFGVLWGAAKGRQLWRRCGTSGQHHKFRLPHCEPLPQEQEEKGKMFREFTFPVLALMLNGRHHVKKHALTPSMHP